MMDEQDILEAANRHVNDAIDALDTLERQSGATYIALALLTGAEIAVDARLNEEDE